MSKRNAPRPAPEPWADPTVDEGRTKAGTRYLISDRDLDALGWAIMIWEDREAGLAAREVRHAA